MIMGVYKDFDEMPLAEKRAALVHLLELTANHTEMHLEERLAEEPFESYEDLHTDIELMRETADILRITQ